MKISRVSKYILSLSVVGTGDYQGGPKYINKVSMSGKTIIITGANSGIGKATALDLAKRGGRILMACRDMEKCEVARKEIMDNSFNPNIVCKHLDLASLQSIRAFSEQINKEEKRVDVLINNAGIMEFEKKYTTDGFESHLGVNYLGHFLLTNLLLNKLISSHPSRIINLLCVGYNNAVLDFNDFNSELNFNNHNAMKLSKLGVALFTIELARQLEGKGVTVNAVNPGLANTDIRRNFPQNKSFITSVFVKPFMSLIFLKPSKAAHTLIYAAVDPTISNTTGKLFIECDEFAFDQSILIEQDIKRLWLIAEKWTRLL